MAWRIPTGFEIQPRGCDHIYHPFDTVPNKACLIVVYLTKPRGIIIIHRDYDRHVFQGGSFVLFVFFLGGGGLAGEYELFERRDS